MPNLLKHKPTRLMSEEEVLKRLDIPDFRHLSKAKAIEFISAIPQMDKDVAIKALEQFPELANTALGIAKETKDSLLAAFDANDKSSQVTLACINTVIEVLSQELEKEELSSEEKLHIVDCLTKLAEDSRKLYKDNQNFILKGLVAFASVAATVVLGTVVALGANGKVELPDLGDSSEDDSFDA